LKTIDEWAYTVHENAKNKGFHDFPEVDVQVALMKLALVHSEVSEVLEAYRKEQGADKIMDEIADICIRTFDFYQMLLEAGQVRGSLDEAISIKHAKNTGRPHMHGVLA